MGFYICFCFFHDIIVGKYSETFLKCLKIHVGRAFKVEQYPGIYWTSCFIKDSVLFYIVYIHTMF